MYDQQDLVEVIKGDGSNSATHTGGQGLAGITHKVRDTEEAPQIFRFFWYLEVPARKVSSGLSHPRVLPPWSLILA